ncbi:MAG: hypothetical protein OEY29_16185, partial [Gammaproteobacteria bacterium]|nr:hypothetical protein [Gammaproteobacteria bacterium]
MDSKSRYLVAGSSCVLLVFGLLFGTVGFASETGVSVDISGELKYATVFNFKDDSRFNELQDDIEGDHHELTIEANIVNGPFSGTMLFEEVDDETVDPADTAALLAQQHTWQLTIDNLQVHEGDLVFGQLDAVNTTDDYVKLVTDEINEGLGYDAILGIRYYHPEIPFVAQYDANYESETYLPDFEHDNFWGLAANYLHQTGESEIHADIHIADDPDNIMRPVFVGVAADIDLNLRNRAVLVFQRAYDMTYGARFERQTEHKFYYIQFADPSWDAQKDTITKLGRVYDSPFTPMVYTLELTRIDKTDLWLEIRADYLKHKY